MNMRNLTRTKKGPGRRSAHPKNEKNILFGDKQARKASERKIGLSPRGY